MTESVRRRSSKWDLKEDSHSFPTQSRKDNAPSGRGGEYIYDKESRLRGFNSREPKWSDIEAKGVPRNDLSGSLSSVDHSFRNNRDYNELPKAMMFEDDQTSPGHGWTQKTRDRSPKSGWSRSRRSRSRSRSPPQGYRREIEGSYSRRSSRQAPCAEFAVGRCRRGSTCNFLHQENHDFDRRRSVSSPEKDGSRRDKGERFRKVDRKEQIDRDISHGYEHVYEGDFEKSDMTRHNELGLCNEFLRGKCHKGSSCRYAHHGASSDIHARDHDRKETNSSTFGHDNRRGPRRIPCRFFAAGNCRNGDTCKFSHELTDRGSSPEGRSSNDTRSYGLDHEKRVYGGGSRWSEIAPDSANDEPTEQSTAGKMINNLGNESRSWGGPKWGETVADPTVNLPSWGNDKDAEKSVVAVESRSTAGNMVGQNLDSSSRTWGAAQSWNVKPSSDRNFQKSPQWTSNNNGGSTGLPESNGSGNFFTSESMFPARPYQESGHKQGSPSLLSTGKPSLSQVVSGQPHSSSNVNKQSPQLTSSIPAFNLYESVHQQIISHPSSNPFDQTKLYQEDPIEKPDVVDTRLNSQVTPHTATSQNLARGEQVTQITNLSASLNLNLPQLYAALNPNSVGPTPVVASQPSLTQTDRSTESQKQYDPVRDSIDLNKPIPPSTTPAEPSVGHFSKMGGLEENFKETQEPVKVVDKEQENGGNLERVDADGKIDDDEGKKSGKDPKGIRMFKFALVELVKELLKPTWKEGQMSKDAHKTIVKKVVDKVTGTVQGSSQIPQTQEKIDQYLAYSKPKLTKLVQAYVEKCQKT